MAEGFSAAERELLSRSEFAVCVGTFYEEIAERLVNGAVEGFAAGGVSPASVHTYETPGAFEVPLPGPGARPRQCSGKPGAAR